MLDVSVGMVLQHLVGCVLVLVETVEIQGLLLQEDPDDVLVGLGNRDVQRRVTWGQGSV